MSDTTRCLACGELRDVIRASQRARVYDPVLCGETDPYTGEAAWTRDRHVFVDRKKKR